MCLHLMQFSPPSLYVMDIAGHQESIKTTLELFINLMDLGALTWWNITRMRWTTLSVEQLVHFIFTHKILLMLLLMWAWEIYGEKRKYEVTTHDLVNKIDGKIQARWFIHRIHFHITYMMMAQFVRNDLWSKQHERSFVHICVLIWGTGDKVHCEFLFIHPLIKEKHTKINWMHHCWTCTKDERGRQYRQTGSSCRGIYFSFLLSCNSHLVS